jgi:hypothetical protein
MGNVSKSSPMCFFSAGLVTLLAVGIGILPSSSPAGSKKIIYTFEMKVKLSDVIVLGEVKEIKRKWIFFREALVEPLSILKGKPDSVKIGVKLDGIKAEVGRRYFLFLVADGSVYKLTGDSLGLYYVMDNGYVSNVNAQFPHDDIMSVDAFTLKIKEQLGIQKK